MDNGTHTAVHSAGLFTESEVRHSANPPAAGVAAAATVLSASQPASLPASHTYHVMCHTMMNMLPFH